MSKRFFWTMMCSISLLNGFLFYLASNAVLKHGIDGVDNQGALLVIPFLWMVAMAVLPVLNLCTFVYGKKIDKNTRIHITDIFHLRRLCKMIKIYNAVDEIEASYILDMLKGEGIFAYAKDPGTGEYMRITQGYSVYGKNIYVDERNKEAAERLIHSWLEEQKALSEEEITYKVPWYRNRMIVARCILAGIGITWIVLLIMERLQ